MITPARIIGIVAVFLVTTAAWMALGGVTQRRNMDTAYLDGQIGELWGNALVQQAPSIHHVWNEPVVHKRTEERDGKTVEIEEPGFERHTDVMPFRSGAIEADIHHDERRKGLVWYSLYGVAFQGEWRYEHRAAQAGTARFTLALPSGGGTYDNLVVRVDGKEVEGLEVTDHVLQIDRDVVPGDTLRYEVAYETRGRDMWEYALGHGVVRLRDFALRMRTDFADIDFPPGTLSPSAKQRTDDGWELDWRFEQVVTSKGIGVATPTRIQPGELAAALSFSAPVSLFFFFSVLFMLAAVRGIDIHPVNYFLIAGAFFAFHLLFAYSADHLPVELAFGLASAASVTLVVSYLRLVVSSRFAYREAAAAQLVYLVGFGLAHFWEGLTGLTVAVLATLTLFVLMQLTGRTQWSSVFTSGKASAVAAGS